MFKFRNKEEIIGIILGAICFVPVFLVAMGLGLLKHNIISVIILLITQFLWLTSITLCTRSLEKENRKLKNTITKL